MFIDLKIENVVPSTSKWSDSDVVSYKKRKNNILIDLETYLLDRNNLLDAAKIQQSVFPERDIDVFISHSHTDEKEAIKIALSLEELGLKPFVDSCTWGYADELLRKIDDVFSKPDGWTTYNYETRNRTTTNVHLILNSALQKMIHRSELFIFLGTENAIRIEEHISNHEQLSSPWIFSELTFVQNVERTSRKQIQVGLEERMFESLASDQKEVEFRYRLPSSTYSIEFSQFSKWLNSGDLSGLYLNGLVHLDVLYNRVGVAPELLMVPRMK